MGAQRSVCVRASAEAAAVVEARLSRRGSAAPDARGASEDFMWRAVCSSAILCDNLKRS